MECFSLRHFRAYPCKHMTELAYLSLGSNVGDRASNLKSAISQLCAEGTLRKVSGFYETQPVDVTNQPWFLNCVVALETGKTPRQLLDLALQIERGMGRTRLSDKGPRNIDIDIVLYGDEVISEAGLNIPHPAMAERRFVLQPLVEVAPEAWNPILRKTAWELLSALPEGQDVRRVDGDL